VINDFILKTSEDLRREGYLLDLNIRESEQLNECMNNLEKSSTPYRGNRGNSFNNDFKILEYLTKIQCKVCTSLVKNGLSMADGSFYDATDRLIRYGLIAKVRSKVKKRGNPSNIYGFTDVGLIIYRRWNDKRNGKSN
jgi:hypothetical protein